MSAEPFTSDRDLAAYVALLGPGFLADLDSLAPGQHWLDAGAGQARAQAQNAVRRGSGAARCTALGLVPPSSIPAGVAYVVGDVATAGARVSADVDLLTDVYGPLQYSLAPHRVVEEYARLLVPGGRLWLMSPATTFVVSQDGGEMDLVDWMRECRGLELRSAPRAGAGAREAVFVRTSEPASVPPLELVQAFDGPPPLRRFRRA